MPSRPSRERRRTARTRVPGPAGFEALPKAEQIRYLQDLWDRITDAPGQIPVPKSHLRLAKERLAAYRKNPSLTRPAHDVLRILTSPNR